MVSGSRRHLAGLLLWLLLALLPLRGVAHGAMGIAALPSPDAAVAVGEAAHAMPCHGGQAADDTDAAYAADRQAASPAGACALCDLCHGVLALPQAAPAVSVMPAAAPCPAWAAAPPARPAGHRLYRPPRA